jgi:hypothetical protein
MGNRRSGQGNIGQVQAQREDVSSGSGCLRL